MSGPISRVGRQEWDGGGERVAKGDWGELAELGEESFKKSLMRRISASYTNFNQSNLTIYIYIIRIYIY